MTLYFFRIRIYEEKKPIPDQQRTERKRVVTNHFRIITYFRPDDRLRARGGHFGHAKKKNLGVFFLRGAAVVSRPNILLLRLARRFPKFATVITPS